MSTEQTDAHNAYQHQIFVSFDEMVQEWFAGHIDYEEVEGALADLEEDPDVDLYTYTKCEEIWTQAKKDDSFWQEEDRQKWEQLEKDSGEVY
jgi:hypothetical protein